MEREAAQEAYTSLHGEDAAWHDGTFKRWSKSRSDEFPYAAGSGVSFGVADVDLAPWDRFTTERDASPERPSVAEQSPGHEDEAAQQGTHEHEASGDSD